MVKLHMSNAVGWTWIFTNIPDRLFLLKFVSPVFIGYIFIDLLVAIPANARLWKRKWQILVGNPNHHPLNILGFCIGLSPSSNDPWQEAKGKVHSTVGVLVLDDSILKRLFSRKVDLVQYRQHGIHHSGAICIDILTMLQTNDGYGIHGAF